MLRKISPWPMGIIAFLSVVVAVNVFFISLAVTSYDGLVDPDYYRKGVLLGQKLKAERELGWDVKLDLGKASPRGLRPVRVDISEPGGRPLEGADIRIILKRPATDRFDASYGLRWQDGSYTGLVNVPLDGIWDIEVKATRDDKSVEKTFRVTA